MLAGFWLATGCLSVYLISLNFICDSCHNSYFHLAANLKGYFPRKKIQKNTKNTKKKFTAHFGLLCSSSSTNGECSYDLTARGWIRTQVPNRTELHLSTAMWSCKKTTKPRPTRLCCWVQRVLTAEYGSKKIDIYRPVPEPRKKSKK